MELVFFLKPIADMLYEYQVLDIVLCSLAIVFMLKNLPHNLLSLDLCVYGLMVVYLMSMLRNTEGFISFIKIESAFLLYFLGRTYAYKYEKLTECFLYGMMIVLAVTLVTLVTGIGFQQWGGTRTFTGLYFFKTDLAAAMGQCMLLYSIFHPQKRKTYIVIALCVFLTFISNTRMFYFIDVMLVGLYYYYCREMKTGKRINVDIRLFIGIIVVIFLLLLILNEVAKSMSSDSLLLFKFDKLSDLNDDANTQGRNQIWEAILTYFFKQDIWTKLVGIDLVSDGALANHNSHSLYVGMLFAIGYIGTAIFAVFFYMAFKLLRKVQNSKLYYIGLEVLIMFLLSGISNNHIILTQMTWMPMFYIGVCASAAAEPKIPKQELTIE